MVFCMGCSEGMGIIGEARQRGKRSCRLGRELAWRRLECELEPPARFRFRAAPCVAGVHAARFR
jgi:hypothetical protein